MCTTRSEIHGGFKVKVIVRDLLFITDFVENQCSYERFLNASFLYADDQIRGLTDKECQARCDTETRFKCIGLTYSGKVSPGSSSVCTLHSDDIISLGPRAVRATTGSVYMRRVRCLNGMTTTTSSDDDSGFSKPSFHSSERGLRWRHDDCPVSPGAVLCG